MSTQRGIQLLLLCAHRDNGVAIIGNTPYHSLANRIIGKKMSEFTLLLLFAPPFLQCIAFALRSKHNVDTQWHMYLTITHAIQTVLLATTA